MSNIMVLPVHNEIVAANDRFMEAYESGDPAAVANLYTEDAKLMPPNSEFAVGHQAIQAVFGFFMSLGIKRIQLETDEVDACGETTIETGRFTLFGPEQVVLDKGKYIVVWKLVNGQWKLHRDIFNSSLPAK